MLATQPSPLLASVRYAHQCADSRRCAAVYLHGGLSPTAWRPLEPYSRGAYLNFLTDARESNVVEVYPSTTYARLASIKAIYDPDNVFNQNQNIKPATKTQVERQTCHSVIDRGEIGSIHLLGEGQPVGCATRF